MTMVAMVAGSHYSHRRHDITPRCWGCFTVPGAGGRRPDPTGL